MAYQGFFKKTIGFFLTVSLVFGFYFPLRALKAETSDEIQMLFNEVHLGSPNKFKSFSEVQRRFLYHLTATHKVASLDHMQKYDPDGIIGFCFGRSMAAHLIARRMGLRADAIRKMFVVGPLGSGGKIEWRFHVTTIVRGENGDWYAIDPIMGSPLTEPAWIQRVKIGWDQPGKGKYYVVSPEVVLPDLRIIPEIDKETGKFLIEISFDPSKNSEFKAIPGLGKSVFETTEETSQKYFTCVNEKGLEKFDFLKIAINNTPFEYNDYFFDLLKTMKAAPDGQFVPTARDLVIAATEASRYVSFSPNFPENVLSFRFSKISGEKEK